MTSISGSAKAMLLKVYGLSRLMSDAYTILVCDDSRSADVS
jgi:hypothetical protein